MCCCHSGTAIEVYLKIDADNNCGETMFPVCLSLCYCLLPARKGEGREKTEGRRKKASEFSKDRKDLFTARY